MATKVFWLTTSGLNNEEGNWKDIYLKLDQKNALKEHCMIKSLKFDRRS